MHHYIALFNAMVVTVQLRLSGFIKPPLSQIEYMVKQMPHGAASLAPQVSFAFHICSV